MKRSIKLLTLSILLSSVNIASSANGPEAPVVAFSAASSFVWGMWAGTYAGFKPDRKLFAGAVGIVSAASAGAYLDSLSNTHSGSVTAGIGASAGFLTAFVPLRTIAWIYSCVRSKPVPSHCSHGCHCSNHCVQNFAPVSQDLAASKGVPPIQSA